MPKLRKNLSLLILPLFSLFVACVTPKPPPAAPASITANESCYCGWVKPSQDEDAHCAVWLKNSTDAYLQPVLASQPSKDCDIGKCREYFSTKTVCKAFTWYQDVNSQASDAPTQDCYCDWVTVSGDTRGHMACGMWRAEDRFLKEYHFRKTCEPEDCQSKDFLYAKSYCQMRFRKYYD